MFCWSVSEQQVGLKQARSSGLFLWNKTLLSCLPLLPDWNSSLWKGSCIRREETLVSLHGEYPTSHTLELQPCQDGFGQGLTSSPALSRWTLFRGTLKTGHPSQLTRCPSSFSECTEAEEIAGTSQEKWDFVVIALMCLEPSEVSAGGFKKHSAFPLSRRLKPQGKDIPCWENQSLCLLFLSVLTIISSYHKAKSCQGWLIILTIKQNKKNK